MTLGSAGAACTNQEATHALGKQEGVMCTNQEAALGKQEGVMRIISLDNQHSLAVSDRESSPVNIIFFGANKS